MWNISDELEEQYFATIGGIYPFRTDLLISIDGGKNWVLIPDAKGSVTCDRTSQVRWTARITCGNVRPDGMGRYFVTRSDGSAVPASVIRDQTRNQFGDVDGADAYLGPIVNEAGEVVDPNLPIDYWAKAPYRARARIIRRMTLPSGVELSIPWGVYRIDKVVDQGHRVDLDLYGFEKQIQDTRFIKPRSYWNQPLDRMVRSLVTEAVPGSHIDYQVSRAIQTRRLGKLGPEERDRWAMLDGSGSSPSLAKLYGLEFYYDGGGRFQVAPVPTIANKVAWDIGYDEGGYVFGSPTTERSRTQMYNVVVVTGEREVREMTNKKAYDDYQAGLAKDRAEHAQALRTNPDHKLFARKRVVPKYEVKKVPVGPWYFWDGDPNSETYAGPDPISKPHLAGPFGVVPRFYHSPLVNDAREAASAGRSILRDSLGMITSASFTAISHPAIEAGDVVRLDGIPYVLDKVTHSTDSARASYDVRATRVDEDNRVDDYEEVEELNAPDAS